MFWPKRRDRLRKYIGDFVTIGCKVKAKTVQTCRLDAIPSQGYALHASVLSVNRRVRASLCLRQNAREFFVFSYRLLSAYLVVDSCCALQNLCGVRKKDLMYIFPSKESCT